MAAINLSARACAVQKPWVTAGSASAKTATGSSHRGIRKHSPARQCRNPHRPHLPMNRQRIIEHAQGLLRAVTGYVTRARIFYYRVVLAEHRCPTCGGRLVMCGESRCTCIACRRESDPTVAFQTCPACGGTPALRVRRYACRRCGADVASRFLFDGLIFDAAYFRQKVAETRARHRALRERVRQMLAGTRSSPLLPPAADLSGVPGLRSALDRLTAVNTAVVHPMPDQHFDLGRYQRHIEAHLGPNPTRMGSIPPLIADRRLDRIWRFVTLIFLAHARAVDIWQAGTEIMVMRCETDRKGQDLPGDVEAADGVAGPLGGAEAWSPQLPGAAGYVR